MKYSEKLFNKYKEEIESWDWIEIRTKALENCYVDQENDNQVIASFLLGSVLSLYPSGKYYMPWCTNQTAKDVIRDTAFSEALEKVANDYNMYMTSGEGDPCDVFTEWVVDDLNKWSKHLIFTTGDDYRLFEQSNTELFE